MTLRERLATAPKGRGHSCSIGILLATWPIPGTPGTTEDRDALLDSMRQKTFTSTFLVSALKAEGYAVNVDHMQQHRRGVCTSGNCPMPNVGLTS